MNTSGWEVIKEFYKTKFGLDGWVVEMYANLDILSLCVSGASIDTISRFLELPISEVIQTCCEVFDFDGWRKDLPINPYRMYCQFNGNKNSVEHFMAFTSDVTLELGKQTGFEDVLVEKLFYMCETYSDIEERIQNEWI